MLHAVANVRQIALILGRLSETLASLHSTSPTILMGIHRNTQEDTDELADSVSAEADV